MSLKLTWDDLLIRPLPAAKAMPWLSEWDWLVTGNVMPLFMTKFGNWFLRRPDNSVELLNILEGTLTPAASSLDDFYALTNVRSWQEEQLLSLMIYGLHEEGKIPVEDECYGFAPPPQLSGKILREHVTILPIHVWQRICAQLFK